MGRAPNISGICRRALSRIAILASCMVASLALAVPAQAQSQRSIDVRTAIFGDLSITKTKDMDFGNIVETTGGTVVMAPTPTPTCTVSGSVVQSGVCQPAEFGGKGETNRIVRIKKPPSAKITLTGPGAPMEISDVKIDGSPELNLIQETPGYSRYRIVSPTGIFIFRVGGTLNVAAGQAPGVYTGTFEISIQYN